MSEQNKPFVITDRRKFTLDGEPRPDADPSPEKVRPTAPPAPEPMARVVPQSSAADRVHHAPVPFPSPEQESPLEAMGEAIDEDEALAEDPNAPPAPTPEQMEQSRVAFEATAERLDTAIRAANPGAEHNPPMSFERLVQSVYMTAIMQLGGATPEGQKPQVDLIGAIQSIQMLTVINEKSTNNLSRIERTFLDSALFELRLAFLDVTQALARSAAAKAPAPGTPGFGPNLVR